ncbi:alpha/beta hydrolase [Pedobacter cryophilus]|uniref:Alpha/beta hydrolase n=1 Tax=Pedobacter cryophilus TaxID=2571271 RepID=A0A4U1C3B0_9SPHI|nr:alpha/beta hydrolase [Pedobacter cryophilus]TKC00280.1 alpha/beta hydrolase [Pedobacter cryophilus]
MIDYYFDHPLAKIHYYRFGVGDKPMLCFHGYGMHGKQFKVLEEQLGHKYTFYGFDLFFHKETVLKHPNLEFIKKGISKKELSDLFLDFCNNHQITTFSVLSYSMGSHYAATLVEEVPERINEFITAAPSTLQPGWLVTFLSTKKVGNKLLERLALSDKGMLNLLKLIKKVKIVDDKTFHILHKEIETYELRFAFYASTTFLKQLELNSSKFITNLNTHQIKSFFIFGARDKNYPEKIGYKFIPKIKNATQLVLDENHEMINVNFSSQLTKLLNDY